MSSGSMHAPAPRMSTNASAGVMVGGAMMLPTRTLVQNASGANNLTTLVAAVQAADLAATLSGPGPFTVFAPPNSAFDALPQGHGADAAATRKQDPSGRGADVSRRAGPLVRR